MPICNIRYNWGFFPAQQVWVTLGNNAGKLGVNHQEIQDRLRNVALAVDTRGQILRVAVKDAKERMLQVEGSVSNDKLNTCNVQVSDGLLYGMLCSVDCFLFESWSLYKLIERFYVSLLRRAKLEHGKEPVESFERLVKRTEDSVGNDWASYLRKNRHLFSHETAPYAVIEFRTEEPSAREVLIESELDEFLRKAEFDEVLKGLSKLSTLCVEDVCGKIQNRASSGRSS